MITDTFREELISELNSGSINYQTLAKYKYMGMDKDTMYKVLDSLRDEMRKKGDEELEDEIMDAMDLVVGWCSPQLKLFPDQETIKEKQETTKEKKVYQTRMTKKPIMFIGTFLATAILSFLLLVHLFYQFDISSSVPLFVWILIPVVLGAIVAPIATFNNKQVTITIDGETFTYVKGEDKAVFPIQSFRGTHVTQNYINGAAVDPTRFLKFLCEDGKIRQVQIPFGEKIFSDMVTQLEKMRRADISEESKEVMRESFTNSSSFEIPKEKLSQAFKHITRFRISISLLIAFISLAVCVVSYIFQELMFFIAMTLLFGGVGLTLAIGVYLYGRKETKNALANTPAFVSVEPIRIIFEKDSYDASDISKLLASPPGYNSLGTNNEFRMIVVTDRNGVDHKYYFGRALKDNRNMVYEDYSNLIAVLTKWSFANNIDFRMDLG